jgi:hypothetical protein
MNVDPPPFLFRRKTLSAQAGPGSNPGSGTNLAERLRVSCLIA